MRVKGDALEKRSTFPFNQVHLYTVFRVILGIVFLWASYGKILEPELFARIVYNYRILPDGLIGPVAIVLPWVEAICGIMLVTGYMVKGAVVIVNLLMMTFILALIASSYRGIDISCGCFSLSSDKTGNIYMYLIRDVLIFLLSSWVLIYRIKTDQ
jgi:putative oxidoreductase